MEQHGLCANRFALLCHRSSIHHACAETRQASLKDDSLNQGILILGGGEEQTHLYDGQFIDIKVVHDRYYNLNLKAVGWHGEDAIPLPPTDSKLEQRGSSNAILDSGASLICLPESLFKRLLQSLYRLNPDAASVLEPFIHELSKVQQMLAEGIPCNQLKLEQWPELLFYLEGEKGRPAYSPARLTVIGKQMPLSMVMPYSNSWDNCPIGRPRAFWGFHCSTPTM